MTYVNFIWDFIYFLLARVERAILITIDYFFAPILFSKRCKSRIRGKREYVKSMNPKPDFNNHSIIAENIRCLILTLLFFTFLNSIESLFNMRLLFIRTDNLFTRLILLFMTFFALQFFHGEIKNFKKYLEQVKSYQKLSPLLLNASTAVLFTLITLLINSLILTIPS